MLRIFGMIAGLCLAAAAALPAWAMDGRPSLVIEAATGRVVHEEAASAPWYPASLTKLLTTYVVLDAIRAGEVTLDTPLTYSAFAAATPPAKMGFKPGTVVTVDNALKMLIVRSANDVAVMIAENLGGPAGVEGFVRRMNALAVRLGMSGSRFINPHGLPGEGQVTTARDMALLAHALYRDFPDSASYFNIGAIKLGDRRLRSYNLILSRYDGAEGMKTGFICASGFNLVASASRGGRRLIAVVFGSSSGRQRAEDAARLLEDAFTAGTVSASTVQQLTSNLGTPPDLREEICLRRPGSKPASEGEGVDSADSHPKTRRPSVLAAKAAVTEAVPVFIGPKPGGSKPGPALESPQTSPEALALGAPLPMARPPMGETAAPADPAEIVREVKRAVAGQAGRPEDAPRINLSAGAKVTTPPMPADRPTTAPASSPTTRLRF